MTIRAKPLSGKTNGRLSWLRVHAGEPLDVTLEISDSVDSQPVDWEGHTLRFRVYSQVVDQAVVAEITDPMRCRLESEGIWKLRLTAEETASLPRGGMIFTLEHRESDGDYRFGMRGGISCCEVDSGNQVQVAESQSH